MMHGNLFNSKIKITTLEDLHGKTMKLFVDTHENDGVLITTLLGREVDGTVYYISESEGLLQCARSVCGNTKPQYWNNSTKRLYCMQCAAILNRENPEANALYGEPLCVLNGNKPLP